MVEFLRLQANRRLLLDGTAHVMGVLNVTPDSFYASSRVLVSDVVDRAARMVAAGVSILDVGGESTRPGAAYVGQEEELERVVPAIGELRCRWDIALSVDTRKAVVAQAAVAAGADMINDVAALGDDPDMAPFCAAAGLPVILMHKKGIPATMQEQPYYEDCPAEVRHFLLERAEYALSAGVAAECIILDPGIGFGKRLEDNVALLNHLDSLVACGYPVLVGLSRKNFIGQLTGRAIDERLAGSLAALLYARLKGAVIFRVHDVVESVDALRVFDALRKGGWANREFE
ncbi:MAG: dihydropteroate synthase [Spirochaetes bacterium GWD1_61_31]|nr:MAG: dihydropteroate synthase [Spirochaetes bacterium GWB1_60_80]OHD34742.1 MAG: dihydropteroate synthase [Spirochaetes bacterium GWC1_61_12]OHD38722.1 MAG: dihydropteroate synthase [Spirochaetes bacterium GWD1_61_31]OHD44467.1 MAG: dihydropteroate synthase [Spirochaetes bacterium GWE1_60_18]OHD59383.1 MAG: dihydropteroate synthase [Spirochaetes bacterium GWF1_60_12]HAP43117.1 dihydropteroate synthase [Spirochaetaceae bacterium]